MLQEQQQTKQPPQQEQQQGQQLPQRREKPPRFPASPSAEAMDTEQNALLRSSTPSVAPKRATEGQAGRPIEPKKTRSSRDSGAGGGDRGRG